jgi:hypothetical protein
MRSIIKEKQTGTRTIAGTDWPVTTQLVRDAIPGRKPTWLVVRDLCNGVPLRSSEYATRRLAEEAFSRLIPE